MKKFMIIFSYDGSGFNGYQKQPNKRTVQSEIEEVLTKVLDKETKISASGRTDAKVHAYNQTAHFSVYNDMDEKGLLKALRGLLPKDIYIKNVKRVDNSFHARYNVKNKTYIYKINIGEYNPFDRNYIYQYNKKLNFKEMKKAIKLLTGKHNFKAFSKSDEKKDYIREIYKVKIELKNDILSIEFTGNGFLRYMVRNMVGLLIEIGENKRKTVEIKGIIRSEDRTKAGITAPPEGLYLKEVNY